MDEDAGSAEPGHDTVREIAGALRCAAGHHNDVATRKRAAQGTLDRVLVIRKRAEINRFAAGLCDGRGENGAIAVEDARGTERIARPDELVAAGEHCHFGLAHDFQLSDAAGCQHPDLPRGEKCLSPQHGFAPRDIGAGIGYELSGADGAARFYGWWAVILDELAILDHQHGVCPARHDPTGGDRACRAGRQLDSRIVPANDHFAVKMQAAGGRRTCAYGIGRAKRKPIDIGAIEWGDVDRRGDILGKDAAERGGERDPLTGKSGKVEVPRKARARLLGRDHFQKLLLPRGAPNGGDEIGSTIGLDI